MTQAIFNDLYLNVIFNENSRKFSIYLLNHSGSIYDDNHKISPRSYYQINRTGLLEETATSITTSAGNLDVVTFQLTYHILPSQNRL